MVIYNILHYRTKSCMWSFAPFLAVAAAAAGPAAVVHTKFGYLEGRILSNGVAQYMGIPYALPPTGERRFADPVSLS
jgi:hypothetical protein